MLSCAAGRMSQTHELGALLLSVCMSPTCVRLRDGMGGGESVSPRHNARCIGAEGSLEPVTARAGTSVQAKMRPPSCKKPGVRGG